jgi:hypothetical protein
LIVPPLVAAGDRKRHGFQRSAPAAAAVAHAAGKGIFADANEANMTSPPERPSISDGNPAAPQLGKGGQKLLQENRTHSVTPEHRHRLKGERSCVMDLKTSPQQDPWYLEFADRLRCSIGDRPIREVGRQTGFNHESIRRYMRTGKVPGEFVAAYCGAFRVRSDWLLLGIGSCDPEHEAALAPAEQSEAVPVARVL